MSNLSSLLRRLFSIPVTHTITPDPALIRHLDRIATALETDLRYTHGIRLQDDPVPKTGTLEAGVYGQDHERWEVEQAIKEEMIRRGEWRAEDENLDENLFD